MTKKKLGKTKPKTIKEEAPTFIYHLKISINDTIVESDTNSIHEALRTFIAPDIIKTKVIITGTKGKVVRERVLNTFDARRLFHNNTALTLLADTLVKDLG